MKDRIRYDEQGIMNICSSIRQMADEIGGTAGGLSAAKTIMDAMPDLVCAFAFGKLNPVFTLAALVRRTLQTGTVVYALVCARRQVSNLEDNLNELVKRIQKASDQFLNVEMKLVSHFTSGGATDNPFDLNGQNGGDQGLTKQRIDQNVRNSIDPQYYPVYRDIIERNTGRTFADDNELQRYLDQMNSCGCGYVALINAIVAEYKDRPADFERDFGIPLYRDGDFNYDQILVDFYSTVDQPGVSMTVNPNGKSGNADNFMKTYFESKNLPVPEVTYSKRMFTADEYRQMIANGEAQTGNTFLLLNGPIMMRNADGTESPYFGLDGGHYVTITGTDGDYFTISTWGDGQSYIVDPSDYNNQGNYYVCQVNFK